MSKFGVGKGLSGTQTSSTKGRAASGVVCQSSHGASRGERQDPPGKERFGVGRRLSGAATKNTLTPKR